MSKSFFALISRMRYISRWGLMRNSLPENIQEHSHMVAVVAHALAVIRRDVFGKDCDPGEYAAIALFHDAPEILTGDLPTPIKYYNSSIKSAYKEVEAIAAHRLIELLPKELQPAYEELLTADEDKEKYALIKAADKITAYIKCVEERKAGNGEFLSAEKQTLEILLKMELPEVDYFIKNFMPAFELTLDELGGLN